MPRATLLGATISRRFALLAGALLLRPLPTAAQSGQTGMCYLTYKLSRVFIKSWSTSGDADDRPTAETLVLLNLHLTFAPDGSPRMDGAILVVSAVDGPMPFDGSGRPRRLVAQGTPAQASCADADGDGIAGLIRVAAELRDDRSGELVPVVLETLPRQDIDEAGRYSIKFFFDEEPLTLDVRVTLGPARRRRKGRRKGRRRR